MRRVLTPTQRPCPKTAATTPRPYMGFASDFRRTRRHPNQPRNFSALRRYVGRIRFLIHSRSRPNNYYSSCRFRTAHRKDHFRRLTLRAAARQEVTPIGADGRIRTCDFPSSRFALRSDPLPRLRYICILPLSALIPQRFLRGAARPRTVCLTRVSHVDGTYHQGSNPAPFTPALGQRPGIEPGLWWYRQGSNLHFTPRRRVLPIELRYRRFRADVGIGPYEGSTGVLRKSGLSLRRGLRRATSLVRGRRKRRTARFLRELPAGRRGDSSRLSGAAFLTEGLMA